MPKYEVEVIADAPHPNIAGETLPTPLAVLDIVAPDEATAQRLALAKVFVTAVVRAVEHDEDDVDSRR